MRNHEYSVFPAPFLRDPKSAGWNLQLATMDGQDNFGIEMADLEAPRPNLIYGEMGLD